VCFGLWDKYQFQKKGESIPTRASGFWTKINHSPFCFSPMNFPEWSLLMARINRSLNELFTNTAADENISQIYASPVLPSLQF